MKKAILFVCLAFVWHSILAEGGVAAKPSRSARIRAAQMRRFGGLVVRPDSGRGRLAVVNAGTAHGTEIARAAAAFAKELRIRVEVIPGTRPSLETADALRRETGAEAVLFVADDEKLPTLLAAPENRWVYVNVALLSKDATSREMVARRVRCEVARGLALLAGAANSTFPGSLMSAVNVPADLDRVSDEIPPAEVFARMPGYLKGLGVTPVVTVPYCLAVKEGWAPAPTNDYQKAAWERVRSEKERGPANGLRIEPRR